MLAESTNGCSAGAAGEGEACQPPAHWKRGLGLVPLPCWQQGQPWSVPLPPDPVSGLPLLWIYCSGWGSFGAVSGQQGAVVVGPLPAGAWPPCTRPAVQRSAHLSGPSRHAFLLDTLCLCCVQERSLILCVLSASKLCAGGSTTSVCCLRLPHLRQHNRRNM